MINYSCKNYIVDFIITDFILTLEGHTGWVNDMVLLLDGTLCSVSRDGGVKIWNVEAAVIDAAVKVNNGGVDKVIKLHDGRLVVSDYNDRVYIIGE